MALRGAGYVAHNYLQAVHRRCQVNSWLCCKAARPILFGDSFPFLTRLRSISFRFTVH